MLFYPYPFVIYLFLGLFGLAFGSFFNVVIYRLPRKESLVKDASHCPNCGAKLKAYDMIPVVSYLLLGGKCRTCKKPIHVRYPIVELCGAAVFLLAVARFGLTLQALTALLTLCLLLLVAFIDIDTGEIPDILVILLLVVGAVSFLLPQVLWYERLIGFACVSLPMLLAALFLGGFGGGDVKLMAAVGLILGWKNTLLGTLLACICAALFALVRVLGKKLSMKDHMPFGQFLALGCGAALLFGNEIIGWYSSLL